MFEILGGLQCGIEWQSGPARGNPADGGFKGNRRPGDRTVPPWEILPDLNRKIYFQNHHFLAGRQQRRGQICPHAGRFEEEW